MSLSRQSDEHQETHSFLAIPTVLEWLVLDLCAIVLACVLQCGRRASLGWVKRHGLHPPFNWDPCPPAYLQVFLYLDRSHVISTTSSRSLFDTGLTLLRKHLGLHHQVR